MTRLFLLLGLFASGLEQVRGSAYDPTMKRVFFIEHSAAAGVVDKLHVRPLDQ